MRPTDKRLTEKSPRECRHGWTLIEMSIIISLLGIVTLVATSLFSVLMELDTSIASASAFELTAQRFEDQLRIDVSSATGFDQRENGFDLVPASGPVITYRINQETVTRFIDGDRHRSTDEFTFVDTAIQYKIGPQQLEVLLTKILPGEPQTRTAVLGTPVGTSIRFLLQLGRSLRFQSTKFQSTVTKSGDEE
ncbi:pilus assembly FimT family protein [Thalassoglobus sp.]|uniref:pilus assembly FimT family protein n=1 Tax=Thalassoglobus sp. TaxID=2795869 RepID=UPI003AA7FF94